VAGNRAWDDVAEHFGELLRDHRRAAGLTQEQLAERAGVSPRSISELERGGAHMPRRDTISLLARALGLTGTARESFETLIDRQRRLRPVLPPAGRSGPVPPVERPKHNLPRLLTTCIGREAELRQLAPLLAEVPLLTLVGAGGVGKTRLAQELVRDQVANYPDGSWLVELASLLDPSLLADTVASAVGLPGVRVHDVLDTLSTYLQDKYLLLVLDNCEHLVEACADLVVYLLERCPRLHILATSREPLAIPGEVVRRVQPLELPDAQHAGSIDQLQQAASVRLFLERAHAVNHSLVLNVQTAPAVARICIGVDGIPLALELAAARTRMLTVEQLADRLDQDRDVLAATNRAAPAKHRTMRATLDWSHALLTAPEQVLLRRLSVFAGGWTLSSAEEVCSDEGIDPASVLDLLAQLVDRSMVLVDARDTVARYRLLEPIRQYALERLDASGEATEFRARHSSAMIALGLAQQAGSPGPDEIASLDRLEIENDNLRAALAWALSHDRAESALRCCAALFRFWERRGHFQEGCGWLDQALRATPETPTPARGWALNALAFLCWRGGDPDRARPIAEQALIVNGAAGTRRDVAQALLNLGMIAYLRNRPAQALPYLEESVAAARQGAYLPQLSVALTFLGRGLMWVNGPTDRRAAAALHESLGLAKRAQSRYANGHALATLGDLMWGQGNARRALPLWREALLVRAQLTDRRGIAGCIERMALVLAASDRFEPAAWLFGAAEAQHRGLGIAPRHDEELDHDHLLGVTRQALGDAFSPAYAEGQASSADDAVARALTESGALLRPRV
jgi:predicted ATPase/DNA-binding XRE family transcriptional regulator